MHMARAPVAVVEDQVSSSQRARRDPKQDPSTVLRKGHCYLNRSMEQSTDETQPDASQNKTLADRTRSSEETSRRCWCCPSDIGKASNELCVVDDTFVPHRGEYEASQDKNTALGGTNIEQWEKCLEDTHSEMTPQFKDVLKRIQLLEEHCRKLNPQFEVLLKRVQLLEAHRSEMTPQFKHVQKRVLLLEEHCSEMTPQFKGLLKCVQLLEEHCSEMTPQFKDVLKHVQLLEEHGSEMTPQFKDVLKRVLLVDEHCSEMTPQFKNVRKRIQLLEEHCSEMTPQFKHVRKRVLLLEEHCSEMTPQFKDLLNHVQSLEEHCSEMTPQFKDLLKRVQLLEKHCSEMTPEFKDVLKRVLLLEEHRSQESVHGIDCGVSRSQEATNNSHRLAKKEISRMVSLEKFHQKEEECEKLKEEKRVLEQRLDHFLAKAMESHKFSENLNDPCRLSAVLEMYDWLQTHEWEKAKCAGLFGFPMTYKDGSTIIKAVFSTCEEELSQKMNQISELLEILFWKETTSQQLPPGLIKDIKNHIKLLYFNYEEQIYCTRSKPALPLHLQTFQPLVKFSAKCYKTYCLLRLQNPPIKAEWPGRIPPSWVEHVDNKEMNCSIPVNFLWPVLTCGEQVIRKGVIYY